MDHPLYMPDEKASIRPEFQKKNWYVLTLICLVRFELLNNTLFFKVGSAPLFDKISMHLKASKPVLVQASINGVQSALLIASISRKWKHDNVHVLNISTQI